MNNIKAIIDFSGYTGPTLGPAAQTIHDKILANAATFPALPVTMAALQTLINTFNTKLAAKASRATADVIAFNIARHELEVALAGLGGYVNQVAKGDPVLVEKSGFPSYDTTHPAQTAPPAAPTDLRLRQGDLSGQVVARCHPDRQRSMNEAQSCIGDPNVEANWHFAGMFSGGKATLGGFAPGTILWVRVRTAGAKSVMGAWSDPARIVVGWPATARQFQQQSIPSLTQMKTTATLIALLALAISGLAQAADPPKFTAADVPGKWLGVNPRWTGLVVFYPNGTFVRPLIGVGRWELATEKEKPQLVIMWDGYGTDMATMVSRDYFRAAVPNGVFHLYRVPPVPAAPAVEADPTDPAMVAAKARLENSTWQIIHTKNVFLNANGTVTASWDERKGTWKLIAPNALVFDVPWQPAPAKIVTTNLDATILRWTDDENLLGTRQAN